MNETLESMSESGGPGPCREAARGLIALGAGREALKELEPLAGPTIQPFDPETM